MPTQPRCVLKAPESINVYTDGSWKYPLKQYLGIGGAGVWWPGRSLTKSDDVNGLKYIPMSSGEYDMALSQSSAEGVCLYTRIGGHNGSSTRTELAAGIIALCAHGPVHIGSDSKAFVDTANQYMRDIARMRKPRKKWKLVSDGDLWEHFHRAITAKGVHSVRITWVKGHAT